MKDIYIIKEYYNKLDNLLKIVDNKLLKIEETPNEKRNEPKYSALKILFNQLEDLRISKNKDL